MEPLVQDLRQALRGLARRPGFTAVAVITLAVGIGATTAVFSLANWLLLRPIPGAHDDGRLVTVSFTRDGIGYGPTSYRDYQDFEQRTTTFSGLAAESGGAMVALAASGVAARRVRGDLVTANYFDVLGVQPALGRFLEPADLLEGARPVAVLGYRIWVGAFGSDREVIERTVTLNQATTTIVGVAPPDFTGTERVAEIDVWRPITARSATLLGGVANTYSYYFESRRAGTFPELIGRLAPGRSVEQAEADLRSVMAQVVQDFPGEAYGLRGLSPVVRPGLGVPIASRKAVGATMRVLWWVAAVLIVIAVANVTNLTLFRSFGRRNEMAVRRALGAGRARLARQTVIETLSVALVAGACGVAFAMWLTVLFQGVRLPSLMPIGDVRLDGRVLGFGLLIAIAAGLVVGLASLLVSDDGVGAGVRGVGAIGSGRQGRARGVVAVVQLAACLTLLVGALLLTRTVRNLRAVDVGFEPRGLSIFELDAHAAGYDLSRTATIRDEALATIRGVAGVEEAALSFMSPFKGRDVGWPIYRETASPDAEHLWTVPAWVSADYFAVLGIRLVVGRSFSDGRARRSFRGCR